MTAGILTAKHQRGVALIMALVFLILLTLLGLTSINTTTLEEKMANNTRDRDLAFQSAETALVAGEAWINTLPNETTPAFPDSTHGLYMPVFNGTPVWNTVDWSSANIVAYPCTPSSATPSSSGSCAGSQISGVATQPKYIVEYMGPVDSTTPKTIAYRITARGTGGSDAAVVMLQSSYVRVFP
jgi:type IV pilus assembly protein PilX